MNIAEILKNVPKGTKLYSPIFGDVLLNKVSKFNIEVLDTANNIQRFIYTGLYNINGECMLFPSRENRDWDNFYICPFKKGDFIVKECLDGSKFIAIFSHFGGPYEYTTHYLCLLRPDGKFKPSLDFGIGNIQEARLATDSEKKELLDAMARNGYCWNECSMTLKELTLKFKVGDTIRKKGYPNYTIIAIEEDRYRMKNGFFLKFVDQHEWEITKFDIKKLKPFDKVLVRDDDKDEWYCEFYSHYRNISYCKYGCISSSFHQCIPYNDDTKHLVGTKENCSDYYKTW